MLQGGSGPRNPESLMRGSAPERRSTSSLSYEAARRALLELQVYSGIALGRPKVADATAVQPRGIAQVALNTLRAQGIRGFETLQTAGGGKPAGYGGYRAESTKSGAAGVGQTHATQRRPRHPNGACNKQPGNSASPALVAFPRTPSQLASPCVKAGQTGATVAEKSLRRSARAAKRQRSEDHAAHDSGNSTASTGKFVALNGCGRHPYLGGDQVTSAANGGQATNFDGVISVRPIRNVKSTFKRRARDIQAASVTDSNAAQRQAIAGTSTNFASAPPQGSGPSANIAAAGAVTMTARANSACAAGTSTQPTSPVVLSLNARRDLESPRLTLPSLALPTQPCAGNGGAATAGVTPAACLASSSRYDDCIFTSGCSNGYDLLDASPTCAPLNNAPTHSINASPVSRRSNWIVFDADQPQDLASLLAAEYPDFINDYMNSPDLGDQALQMESEDTLMAAGGECVGNSGCRGHDCACASPLLSCDVAVHVTPAQMRSRGLLAWKQRFYASFQPGPTLVLPAAASDKLYGPTLALNLEATTACVVYYNKAVDAELPFRRLRPCCSRQRTPLWPPGLATRSARTICRWPPPGKRL